MTGLQCDYPGCEDEAVGNLLNGDYSFFATSCATHKGVAIENGLHWDPYDDMSERDKHPIYDGTSLGDD